MSRGRHHDPAEPLLSETEPMWHQAETCVDYQVYVCALPKYRASEWQDIVTRLRALGHCHDNAFGITTVRQPWGFFQIPPHDFPELKVTLFQFTRESERQELLNEVAAALQRERKRT